MQADGGGATQAEGGLGQAEAAPGPDPAALPRLHADDFALFGLPCRFALAPGLLDERRQLLQRQAHPDRHAAQGAAAQRVALQWSVRINEAYQRLKDPLRRAAYWCHLQGHAVQAESNTAMPADFLLQQMHWREALAEADAVAELLPLQAELEAERAQRLAQLESHIDQHRNAAAAVQQVRALMFIERFEQQLHDRLDRF